MKIGDLEVRLESRQVLRNGVAVRVSGRAFDLLKLLLEADGALVTTGEILSRIWPSIVVEENNIQVHISALRRLLGEHRHLIQTVSGRGYRMSRPQTAPTAHAPTSNVPPEAPQSRIDYALPHVQGYFFGRETCVAHVRAGIDMGEPVITLTGPAGVGKSRLAIEVARMLTAERSICAAYMSLATQTDEQQAYRSIGTALEALGAALAQGSSAQAPGPRGLLLLDNCDRLAEAVIASLRDSAAFRKQLGIVVLLTTRMPLRVSMERVMQVPCLLTVPAVEGTNAALEMFISRIQMLSPGIDVSATFIENALALVQEMDGLPLAIELAAHHTSLLGIETVRDLLARDIDLPSQHMRRMMESRHASLNAALKWTWADLGSTRHAVLAGLMDAGSEADLAGLRDIAEGVGLSSQEALDAVTELVERCAVLRATDGATITYRIPNTIRRFLRQERASTVTQLE